MAEAGTHVGRFEIIRELGRGGMAVVYLARQTELEREVALKELASFQGGDASGAERFVRESRVSGSLAHRNIVTVYDFDRDGPVVFLTMEYLSGSSLNHVLQTPGFNSPIVLAEEMEERFTAGLDKVPVHAELIKWGFLRGGSGAIHEKFPGRKARGLEQFMSDVAQPSALHQG